MTDTKMSVRRAARGRIANNYPAGSRVPGEDGPVPTIPNTSAGVRDLGINLHARGWPLQATVSWYKSSSIVARWIWEETPYAAIDVYINHSMARSGRYNAHLRLVEKGGLVRRTSEISKEEAEAVAAKLDHQGIWVRNPATETFSAITFVRAHDIGERAAAIGRRAIRRDRNGGASSCAESRRSRRSFSTRGTSRDHSSAPSDVSITMAEHVNPTWDFFAIGPDSLVTGVNDAGDAFRVLNMETDEYTEIPRARFGACDHAPGGEEGEVGAITGVFTMCETTGEASTKDALKSMAADVAGARAHHTTNSAEAGPSINVVKYADLITPSWWLGSAFSAATTMRNDRAVASADPGTPSGAENIANKEAVATQSFDASTAPEGYVSVAAGTPVKFITNAGALTYVDGEPEAIVLARVGRTSYMYGFVPLWVFAAEAEYIPQTARTLRRRPGIVRVSFGSAEPVDLVTSESAALPVPAGDDGSGSQSGMD